MAYTTIDDPSAHFQIALHTSTNAATITNDGNSDLQPDFLWSKARGAAHNHALYDSTRGVTKYLSSNATSAVTTASSGYDLTAFNSDGFTTGNNQFNTICGGTTYVAWQWKANAGTTVSVTESGNNPGGTHQANTTSGFSIVTYTGTGATGTVTHGLGVAPKFIMIKNRGVTDPWAVYYGDNTDYLVLNTNAATVDNAAWWNDTSPSSTVFTVSTDHSVNADAETYLAYCFAEVQGFSKIGSYVGNGDAIGPFIYTGFKPAWILIKQITDAAGDDWILYDNKREPVNVAIKKLFPNQAAAESSSYDSIDMLSNGFKTRTNLGGTNSDGKTYIYMAFAHHPFVTSDDGGSIPTTAR